MGGEEILSVCKISTNLILKPHWHPMLMHRRIPEVRVKVITAFIKRGIRPFKNVILGQVYGKTF
jgi:hypothetical protein